MAASCCLLLLPLLLCSSSSLSLLTLTWSSHPHFFHIVRVYCSFFVLRLPFFFLSLKPFPSVVSFAASSTAASWSHLISNRVCIDNKSGLSPFRAFRCCLGASPILCLCSLCALSLCSFSLSIVPLFLQSLLRLPQLLEVDMEPFDPEKFLAEARRRQAEGLPPEPSKIRWRYNKEGQVSTCLISTHHWLVLSACVHILQLLIMNTPVWMPLVLSWDSFLNLHAYHLWQIAFGVRFKPGFIVSLKRTHFLRFFFLCCVVFASLTSSFPPCAKESNARLLLISPSPLCAWTERVECPSSGVE